MDDYSYNDSSINKEKEIILKKVIGKDCKLKHYFNSKMISKEEYGQKMSLLGIEQIYPSNFAMQGKIKRISQLSEVELFNLLTEIVGTKVYEEGRNKSVEIVEKIDIDEKKAADLLEEYRQRLNELEHDKKDFQKYKERLEESNK